MCHSEGGGSACENTAVFISVVLEAFCKIFENIHDDAVWVMSDTNE